MDILDGQMYRISVLQTTELCYKFNGFKLSWANVSGVPQGAVLCPLLSFLHINDIISDIVI